MPQAFSFSRMSVKSDSLLGVEESVKRRRPGIASDGSDPKFYAVSEESCVNFSIEK
jgi:hypothetical protein